MFRVRVMKCHLQMARYHGARSWALKPPDPQEEDLEVEETGGGNTVSSRRRTCITPKDLTIPDLHHNRESRWEGRRMRRRRGTPNSGALQTVGARPALVDSTTGVELARMLSACHRSKA